MSDAIRPGHEIAFVFAVELVDTSMYERDEFEVVEVIQDRETWDRALWVDPSRLDAPLYPYGIAALLEAP